MHCQEPRFSCCTVSGVIALLTSVLVALSLSVEATEIKPQKFGRPFRNLQYHVHYDVNPDGTYTAQYELTKIVLNDMGVQVAGRLPVGLPNGPIFNPQEREVEILSAYTLKLNGERINALPSRLQPQAEPTTGVSAVAKLQSQAKMMSFQNVVVGDSLAVSYKVVLKKSPFPNNVVIDESFPKFVEFDDVQVSLNAPTSLKLRFETVNADKGKSDVTGNTLNWIWKYQNKEPETLLPNKPPSPNSFTNVHISSFSDEVAEITATQKLTSSIPIPINQHCQILPGNPNDGPEAVDTFTSLVANFFWNSDDVLKRELNDWNIPPCVFDDGRPRLGVLLDGFDQAFNMENDWSKSLARVEVLKKKFPEEAFVALVEAKYWIDYAWNARGGGYASSITDDGRKLFKERLEKAEKILLDTKSFSAQFPAWYSEMIIVQSALDRSEDERDKVFLEGVKRYPTYYPIYFTMQNYLLPKWGGSWRAVDNLVKWSVEHTKVLDGNTMYARIYWSVSGDPQVNLFKDTFVSWPKMKRGFEDMMARYPKSKWNLNNFAKFACMAGDKQTFLNLRTKINKDVLERAWPENTSLDFCEMKFGYEQ